MKTALFALALVTAGATFAQPSFAATEEPAAAAAEPTKAKPAKAGKAHRHGRNERHSSLVAAHKA
ncbi:MAG: hypothetical protein ACR650_06185 [Methylocystis sp.]